MVSVQNETLVETLRRSWLHLIDADAPGVNGRTINARKEDQPLNGIYADQVSTVQVSTVQVLTVQPPAVQTPAVQTPAVKTPAITAATVEAATVKELEQQIQRLQQQQQALLQQHQLVEQDSLAQNYLRALGRIAQRLQNSLDETEIFQTVIQELVQALQLLGAQVRLYNADGSLVIARHEYIPGNERDATAKIRRVDFPLEGLDLQPIPKQFCVVNLASVTASVAATPARTLLQYPLMDAMGILGLIQLERDRPDCFSPIELEFMQQVAAQCAIALRRNRFAQINKTQTVELKHLNQLQDAFLGTVSYELRIPLANIRMAIQMITLALTKETDAAVSEAASSQVASSQLVIADATLNKILRYLEVLQRECDRETKLIQDLLDLQQLDMDTLSLVMSAINLEEWLPYVISPFQKRCQEYNLDLQYQIPTDLPAFMCDQITLSRIVSELLGNATKYTPAGGTITIGMETIDGHDHIPQMLRVRVRNTGVEIPIEEQGRIFDKFYRLTKLDIRKLGGTGLGLALVDKLVQRLDGKIELQSAQQQTCFVVDLPFQNEPRPTEPHH
jgi:signal transduction histidine kinase